MKTRLATRGSNATACWSTWKELELLVQLPPALLDSSMGTPGTQMCWDASGSTKIRENHQPNVDCDEFSAVVLVIFVQVSPRLVEVQKPRKLPVALAAMAYTRLGSL